MPQPLQTRDPDVLDLTTRSMQVRSQTANEDQRSIEAVIATDSVVEVWDWKRGEVIDEVLLPRGADIPDQIPLLANHSRWSLDDVLGSARDMRAEDHSIPATLFFAKGDEDADRAWNKASQGHLKDVSVGYRVTQSVEVQPGETATVAGQSFTARGRLLRIATRWALKEVSLVPIGADQAAKLRREHNHKPVNTKGPTMDPKLREYLESIGMRVGVTDEEAEAFHATRKGDERTRADELKDGKRADPPAKDPPPKDGQRSAPQPRATETTTETMVAESRTVKQTDVAQADIQAIVHRTLDQERQRVREITELAGDDVAEKVRDQAIGDGWDVARASGEFLRDVRARRQPGVGPDFESGPAIHSRSREADTNVRSLAAGTLAGQSLDPTVHAMHGGGGNPLRGDRLTEQDADRGEQFAGMSAPDLFRECLRLDTGRYHRTIEQAMDAVREAPSGGSLAWVFGTNVYARLVAGWETTEDTTLGWCDEEDVQNFLQQEDITLEAQARLEQLARGATANDATISDKHETYKIARYAKKFGIDDQDIIDDRLSAIMRMPMEMGMAARRLRPDLVYSVMIENPTLVADTGAVFNATAVTTTGGHANLGTGALASATLKTAITAMGKQRDSNSNVLNITPKYLIFPADLSWTADELLSPAMIAKLFADTADPQHTTENLIARRRLMPVMDDRIGAAGVIDPRTGSARTGSATNWFLAAGGSRSIRVAYRRGTGRSPVMRSNVWDKGQWGMGWDINLDIGAAFMDFRGWYKSTGAA